MNVRKRKMAICQVKAGSDNCMKKTEEKIKLEKPLKKKIKYEIDTDSENEIIEESTIGIKGEVKDLEQIFKIDVKVKTERGYNSNEGELDGMSNSKKWLNTKYELSDSTIDENKRKIKKIKTEILEKKSKIQCTSGNLDKKSMSSKEKHKNEKPNSRKRLQIKSESYNSSDDEKVQSNKIKKQEIQNDCKQISAGRNWQDYELVAEYQNLDLNTSRNILQLLDQGCTLPFIARYRKDATNNMSPEILRDVKHNYDKVITLKARAQTVLNCMGKAGHLDNNLEQTILNARTIEEVEHIYAPYKPGGKRTLAERARALGLQQPAQDILENIDQQVDIYKYVDSSNTELESLDKVEKGISHIIAHTISTDIKVLTYLRKLKAEGNFGIEVKKLAKRAAKSTKTLAKQPDESKYENYFDFKMPVQYMKPHQILAINRGESQKILSVKIVVPDFILRKFSNFCKEKFQYYIGSNKRKELLDESIKDSYSRLLQPLLVREIRSELKYSAEKASYEVFCSNLKQLLLTPPIKGRAILGIDPGFSNGCKTALISPTGTLLTSNVLYLHGHKSKNAESLLKEMLESYNCSLIALGNGTACRETETWLSNLISNKYFSPLDISYIIVNESGASIYSCSPEAKKEFPTLDPNIISAVSLARRIQEPLAEFVKVEPKHLGVGMYQHDLPKKVLEEALDEVVSECVSFVGVDLNIASQCLLRRIAGLSDKRATKIIEYRDNKGPFLNRKQLMKISGIGEKIFEQCAGFLRVGPITADEEPAFYKNSSTNKLDCTIIHPESYELTAKLIKHFDLKSKEIGTTLFINALKSKIVTINFKELSELFHTTEETLKLILDALTKPLNYDLRNDCSKIPLFKKGITNLSDLKVGTILTGRIANVTHFGCFTDIGVGCDGLIHTSKMKGQNLQMGNVAEVKVISIEIQRKRIGLELLRVM